MKTTKTMKTTWIPTFNPVAELKKMLAVRFTVKDGMLKKTYKTNTAHPKGKKAVVYDRGGVWKHIPFGLSRFGVRVLGHHPGPFENGEAFIKGLEKRGFVKLGGGYYSTVLGKPDSDRVIKVTREADGWIDYVHWAAKKGEAGKFAPKVFSYKKIKGKRNDFSVSIMERLEYTFYKAPQDHAMKIIPSLLEYSEDNPMAGRFMEVLAPGLKDYMSALKKQFKGHLDLHAGNLMLRKDGSFVVIDPVSGYDQTDYKRLKAGDFSPALPLILLAA